MLDSINYMISGQLLVPSLAFIFFPIRTSDDQNIKSKLCLLEQRFVASDKVSAPISGHVSISQHENHVSHPAHVPQCIYLSLSSCRHFLLRKKYWESLH